jgi:hypothetical protein
MFSIIRRVVCASGKLDCLPATFDCMMLKVVHSIRSTPTDSQDSRQWFGHRIDMSVLYIRVFFFFFESGENMVGLYLGGITYTKDDCVRWSSQGGVQTL